MTDARFNNIFKKMLIKYSQKCFDTSSQAKTTYY